TLLQLLGALLTGAAVTGDTSSPALALSAGGVTLLLFIASILLVQGLGTAAMTRAVADNYLGQKTGIMEAYNKIGRSWLTLIGALLLAGIVGIGLTIWWIVPCIGWLTGLGILLFFSLVIVPLIAPIIVLERQSASRAIGRAWDLARRRFWWVLGFTFILTLFAQIIVTMPTFLTVYVLEVTLGDSFGASSPTTALIVQQLIQSFVSLILSLIYLPLQLTGITLMYFDLRVRTEGFDLALLAESASGETVDTAAVTARAPRTSEEKLVTGEEMLRFFVVEIGIVALYIAIVFILALIFGPLVSSGF
ncbi:MAG: hypothetical protein L0322_04670, partial [Chloroflexi bacterium]|nr:hypothetical protein [Chloroflexota bacterium]